MTSSMLTGERRRASARRGGMTVIGKIAVPKPINLPSQKLENHGLNPNVEIVPKGTLSWGSKPSSSSSSAWGSSTLSTTTDGSAGSPTHPSGRPLSSGSGTRPSTAGSDTGSSNTWGFSSRPSSASGALTSNQTSLASSRPCSADTRPSSSLSRFAGTTENLEVTQSEIDGFLSCRDFPTLGSEKVSTAKKTEKQEHGTRSRPGSSSSGVSLVKDRSEPSSIGEVASSNPRSENVNTWRNDNAPPDGCQPNMDKWPGEPQPYVNPNMPPHRPFEPWLGLSTQGGDWYRGPPVGPASYPMEYPYYHVPIPPLESGLRGPHPKPRDTCGPHMSNSYIRPSPGMQVRPGFYPPGPVPHESYYDPPMGYCNTNEPRDIPFRGMAPLGPPVYNRYTGEVASNSSKSQMRPAGYGLTTGKALDQEQMDPRGQYKVLLKHHNGSDGKEEEQKWNHGAPTTASNFEKEDQRRIISRETNRRPGYENEEQVKKIDMNVFDSKENLSISNIATLIQKEERSNAKSRDSHGKHESREGQKATLSVNETSLPRKNVHGPQGRVDHRGKGRFNTKEADGWQKKAVVAESLEITEKTGSYLEGKDDSESMSDPSDIHAQRAKMKEIAKQRVKQLQIEEEERIRERKNRARAKLEELNRRAQAVKKSTQKLENPSPVELSINPSQDESNTNSCTQVQDATHKQPEPLKQDVEKAEVIPKQKKPSYKQKLNVSIEKPTTTANSASKGHDDVPVNVVKESSLPIDANAVSEPSVNQRRKNNKHKIEETTSVVNATPPIRVKDANIAKYVVEMVKPKFSERDSDLKPVDPLTSFKDVGPSLPIEESSHFKANNNQSKLQNPRRVSSRIQQVNNRSVEKFHGGGDAVVWAPVQSQKKIEVIDENKDKTLLAEPVQNNLKNKRALMERYVSKPKELSRQGSPSNNQISSNETGSQITGNTTKPPGIEKLGFPPRSRAGSSSVHTKGHGEWRQRAPSESTRVQVPHDESSKKMANVQEPVEVKPLMSKPDVLVPPVKEQAKLDKAQHKGTVNYRKAETDRKGPNIVNKEYAPKPHNLGHREVKREPKNQPHISKQTTHFGKFESEFHEGMDLRHEHQRVPPFHKNTNQPNRSVQGQYRHSANQNRQQQRYNSDYEYQPTRPYNNNSKNFEEPLNGPSGFRERAQNQSKRGGAAYD